MYNKLWSQMPPRTRERDIIHWIEKFRSQFEDLINESDDEIHHFNYVVDVFDWNMIVLYDNGNRFASCDLDLIETPGDLIEWISEAISCRYFDYIAPYDEEYMEHDVKTIKELVDNIKEEPLNE